MSAIWLSVGLNRPNQPALLLIYGPQNNKYKDNFLFLKQSFNIHTFL